MERKAGRPRQRLQVPAEVFELTGGALCLDFANTVYRRPSREPLDGFLTSGDVLRWSRQAGAHPARVLNQASAWIADGGDAAGHAVLRAARAFRDDVFLVFSALAQKRPPPEPSLARALAVFARVFGRSRLERDRAGRWWWTPDVVDTAALLGPVARSVAELLLSPRLEQVKQCAAPDCAWLFIDTSRGHRRRWCDMQRCGNRAKARRHSERARRLARRTRR